MPKKLLPTEAAVEDFRYENVDLTAHNIRVVRILPDLSNDGLIQCQMEEVELSTADYACVSYRWATENSKKLITLNGQCFFVRRNLFDFLKSAIQTSKTDSLWIDAICIDQNNLEEKNHQVQMMGQIFRKAWKVLVWLGKGDLGIEIAFQMIGMIWEEGSREKVEKEFRSRLGLRRSNIKTFEAAMAKIVCFPYWERLWIKQEILMNKNVRYLYGYTHSAFEPRPLSELVRLFSSSACTEIRDRVYGLLSMAEEGDAIRVDYAMTTTELFVHTLRATRLASYCDIEFLYVLISALELSSSDLEEIKIRDVMEKYAFIDWSLHVSIAPIAVFADADFCERSWAFKSRSLDTDPPVDRLLRMSDSLLPWRELRTMSDDEEADIIYSITDDHRQRSIVRGDHQLSPGDVMFNVNTNTSGDPSNLLLVGRPSTQRPNWLDVVAVVDSDVLIQDFEWQPQKSEGVTRFRIYDVPEPLREASIRIDIRRKPPAELLLSISSIALTIGLLERGPRHDKSGEATMWSWKADKMASKRMLTVSAIRDREGRSLKRKRST
ncbi:uncharacterized protein KY384_001147 [Bacidia gigantensis]|uniref:uncharacterized protein n=1 Tax=Bacidia gigantensis TaxID=2732470 RepID=UPI001D05772B|nr:uncharacterized protein KY384_001147 [Bacidia gigantensis]KAG8534303.1 hypothetical protein KY384_001147 [Bacidia gigantensis]